MKYLATVAALLAILMLACGTTPADEPKPMAHPVKKMSLKQCNKLADDRKLAVGSKARSDYIKECRTRRAPVTSAASTSPPPSSPPPAQ
jgi:hypothetical protein